MNYITSLFFVVPSQEKFSWFLWHYLKFNQSHEIFEYFDITYQFISLYRLIIVSPPTVIIFPNHLSPAILSRHHCLTKSHNLGKNKHCTLKMWTFWYICLIRKSGHPTESYIFSIIFNSVTHTTNVIRVLLW